MLSIFIIWIIPLLFCNSECEREFICWSEEEKLGWTDFLGEPNFSQSGIQAITSYKIHVVAEEQDKLPNYTVQTKFSRFKSWTKTSKDSLLLQHEQLHFDIAEVYARKIRQGVKTLRAKDEKGKEKYEAMIASYLNSLSVFQKQYDKETSHGSIDVMQTEWNEKVWIQLQQMKAFEYTADCE